VIVFVHGVPETAAMWDAVRSRLDRPSTALSLPGFGCPRPAGFGATKDEYVAWLVAELEGLGEPVDLVGHDWGAGLTYRVATRHGGLLRSWAADVANILHPDYEWHDFAKIWQAPGAGEEYVENVVAGGPEPMAGAYEGFGVPPGDARRLAGWFDETMGRSILDLYRSATPNIHAHWGADLAPTAAPGLVLHATGDPFSDGERAAAVAATLGARLAVFDGLGHWWAFEDPGGAVAVLTEHWDSGH
jgi:pimeloyl-ACP methyl ester carboxylesterase